ncbi:MULTISPECIES: VOC family protein [Bordetella]|uniref:VOC family protein n=2 Tax=Bordetella TaxID=517 RepID=A0A261VXT7_9BORD|nr:MULTISPECIES: VOC family protein [Bordetella]MDM9562013.1 VOC family protein [Bordetella petrii]OZI78430.1 VOC family protein [Bordetella genomosp. 2]
MPQLCPYLSFDGQCAEAMRFYERTLGGRVEAMVPYSQAPAGTEVPAGMAERIMHARLSLDGQTLMASDIAGEQPYQGQQGVSLALVFPTVSDATRVFNSLAEGGTITMPLQKTFWAEAFGALTDRYGTSWLINGGQIAG